MSSSTRILLPDLAVVDGWRINVATLDEAVEEIAAAAEARLGFTVFTLNLDHLVKLRRHDGFRQAYAAGDFVTADGAPVAALARRQHARVERTTGADLAVPLAREAARRGLPVYLFGTTFDVLARVGRDLGDLANGRLDIAGSEAPEADFDPDGPTAGAAIERIAASGARLCFVALGAPKQELFAARAKASGVRCGFVCVGAALDFLAGKQRRAPRLLRDWSLEWLWRLATSPRRLAGRYALSALVLADIVTVKPLRERLTTRRRREALAPITRIGSEAGE